MKINWHDGSEMDSQAEALIRSRLEHWRIPHVYNMPCLGKGGWRKVDFVIPCTGGCHLISWEHNGMLDVPSYRERWEKVRHPWYVRNASRFPLVTTESPLSVERIDRICARLLHLLANGSLELHRWTAEQKRKAA